MAQGEVETYFSQGVWLNRIIGAADLPGTHATRQEAVLAGARLAQERNVHHVVQYVRDV